MIRIVVTALKGGAGVSTLVSGLCQAAAKESLDVLCIDHDDQGLLKYSFGMVGLADDGEMRNGNPRIRLRGPGEPVTATDLADLVIIDLPRTRHDLSDLVFNQADAVLLIAPASAVTIAQAPAIKRFLAQAENRFLLLNQLDARVPLKKTATAFLQTEFADRIIGQVRQDGAIEEAFANLEPLSRVAPHSAAWSDIGAALTSLLNQMNQLPVATRGSR